MILLIGSEKGGTGKTTIACNLAAALATGGHDVVMVDADPQASAAQWVERRSASQAGHAAVHCVQRTGNIFQTVVDLAGRYEEVIIDAGGRDSKELRSAMLAAHKVYMPARPSQLDLETALHIDELVQAAAASRTDGGAKAYAVLSQCPTHHLSTEAEGAREYLSQFTQMGLAKAVIYERKVYRDAMTAGLGVVEMNNPAATEEVRALLGEIYS